MNTNNRILDNWDPENVQLWQTTGSKIARRNLWVSVFCLTLAFCIWMVFSAVVLKLNHVGFHFSNNQLFWLAALPSISGALLRVPFSFVIPIVGGRRWTTISTLVLIIPSIWLGFAVQDPTTSFTSFAIIAILCGLGGGNFASSMANISFFYPKRLQGYGLGLNGGLGDGGVSVVQLCVPLVIGLSIFGGDPQQTDLHTSIWLQNAAFIWVPFIILASILAWFLMNDIAGIKASLSGQLVVLKKKDMWVTSLLYLATFGSFIGFSAGFALLTKIQFPDINILHYAFLGPLLGAIARPIGGWLSDKFTGLKVTLWNFFAMFILVLLVFPTLPSEHSSGSFALFYLVFMGLFACTNLGSGSSFQMIAALFHTKSVIEGKAQGMDSHKADEYASILSSAALGFASAIGAVGGFIIPKAFGSSIQMTGSPSSALISFAIFYLICIALTWFVYMRKGSQQLS
ncbi:nitrite transporter [Shewanella halifaxensis HAW-EB4]|uniref:Nitrate/nitrite transporter n=1 Tax=Shewanella halifaxensis (strain HAW-EB4) TaxID=458817 RepID=B0TSN1_SHEHH|nr:NarK family nitrate/nitrite MFS transporter [Shewanella halifaxensis]ABZ77985.1 nitrite transporter [Shewanella halifaxensis HAW-EB4]